MKPSRYALRSSVPYCMYSVLHPGTYYLLLTSSSVLRLTEQSPFSTFKLARTRPQSTVHSPQSTVRSSTSPYHAMHLLTKTVACLSCSFVSSVILISTIHPSWSPARDVHCSVKEKLGPIYEGAAHCMRPTWNG